MNIHIRSSLCILLQLDYLLVEIHLVHFRQDPTDRTIAPANQYTERFEFLEHPQSEKY